jgi:type II secretory pathway component PulF
MKVLYHGYDKSGKSVKGVIDAADVREARELLRRQGVFAMKLGAAEAGGVSLDAHTLHVSGKFRLVGGSSKLEKVSFMMRQLSLLVHTGTPVVEALASLEKQAPKGEWRDVLQQIRAKVEEGKSLAEAMSQRPDYFDAVCRSLVAAGESGGQLHEMCDRLSKLVRQQVRIRKTVTHALIYPCLLLCVALGVTITMITFVLPRFEGLFETLGSNLPPMTAILMDVSRFVRGQWYFVVGGLLAALVSTVTYVRTRHGQRTLDILALKIPKLGHFTRAYATARITRVLGTLLDGKVPLLEALALSRHVVRNSLYVALLARAEETVIRGEPLSAALDNPAMLPQSVIEAVRSGEKTGNLAPVLSSVAEFMDEDTEQTIKTVTGLLEPLILLFLGLVVGTMAISMMLPLFDLTAAGAGPGGPGGAP